MYIDSKDRPGHSTGPLFILQNLNCCYAKYINRADLKEHPVEVRLFLLADFANVDGAGKLNIIGSFNRIFTQGLPALHPLMYLVMRITAELGEFDQDKALSIVLFDEDGAAVWKSPDIPFRIPAPQQGGSDDFHPIVALQFTEFHRHGRYEYRVFINGDHKGVLPFDILPLPVLPAAPQE